MKIKALQKTEPKTLPRKGKRGPAPTIGGKRLNFFPGDCFKGLKKLNRLLKEAGIRRSITRSYALREGARMWIKSQLSDARKAVKGELHAKKRKHEI